jgi:hypothetical protein
LTKITVVVEKSTGRIVPFEYGIYGEIIITSTRPEITEDCCNVLSVDSKCVNWELGTIMDAPCLDHIEAHPFNLLYLP